MEGLCVDRELGAVRNLLRHPPGLAGSGISKFLCDATKSFCVTG